MDNMTDKDLEKLLAATPQPQLPAGFADRLQAKLAPETQSNVVAFQPRAGQPSQKKSWVLGALPLAASLLLGIYVGAADRLPSSLAGIETALLSSGEQPSDIGIEDTEAFLNGDLT